MNNMSDFIIENGVLVKYVGSGGDVVVPEGVIAVGKKAFFECEELLSLVLPEGLTTVETAAFERCTNLRAVTFPDTLTEIGTSAFRRCKALLSLSLPDSVIKIGDGAFRACSSLQSISLSKGLKKIGKAMFLGCDLLCEINIPKGIKTISDYAFSDTDVCGQLLYRPCTCPLMNISGNVKISDLAFGSSTKRSSEFAPPLFFESMKLSDIPQGYKRAAAEGFIFVYKRNPDKTEALKSDYIKYFKSQRKKYFDRLLQDEALLYMFLKENILQQDNILALLDSDTGNMSPEIKAILIEYCK